MFGSKAVLRLAIKPQPVGSSSCQSLTRCRPQLQVSRSRFYSGGHQGQSSFKDHIRRRTLRLAPIIGVGALVLYLYPQTVSADTTPSSASSSSSSSSTMPELEQQLGTTSRLSDSLQSTSSIDLIRSYFVYSACSIPLLIDYAPSLLHSFTHSSIPGLKPITEFLVRHTFFKQFVPGESVEECLPAMRDLRSRNIGSVLNYSAEADLSGNEVTKEMERMIEDKRLKEVYLALEKSSVFEESVEKQGGGRGSTAFALKITGLIDPEILKRASTTLLRLRQASSSNTSSSPTNNPPAVLYPGTPVFGDARIVARTEKDERYLLSLKGAVPAMGVLEIDEGLREGDLQELSVLWGKLKSLGEFAKDKKVKLMIDAEHTWYQPALDAYTILLMKEFNKIPKKSLFSSSKGPGQKIEEPLIYGTFQSYLTRQPGFLKSMIEHAESNGYVLGLKVVRGAYFIQERKKWKDDNRSGPDPIWPDKPATDKSYNDSVRTIISQLSHQLNSSHPEKSLNVVFGTHNQESCEIVVECLKKEGLAIAGTDKGSFKLREDVEGKVYIAQLYGMKDDLTDKMASSFEQSRLPFALKYIAYGNLSEVMPFLGRRAIENKSVMSGEGGASAERKRLSGELWRRVFG